MSDIDISKLSLDLAACYFIVPWKSTDQVASVEEWANKFGASKYFSMTTTMGIAAKEAMDEARRLARFVSQRVADVNGVSSTASFQQ